MVQNTVSTQVKKILHTDPKNITILEMNESIVYSTTLEVTGDKLLSQLLRSLKCIVKVVYYIYPFQSRPPSASFVFSETNAQNNQ